MSSMPGKVERSHNHGDDEHQSPCADEHRAPRPVEGCCTARYCLAGFGVTLHLLEIGASVRGMLVTQVAVLLQAFADDLVEFGRNVGVNSYRGHWRALQNRIENQGRRLPSERKAAGRHLI